MQQFFKNISRRQHGCILHQKQYMYLPVTSVGGHSVKTGNLGHQVNLDIHLQTVEIQMRRLKGAVS